MVITIDGPTASGKSCAAQSLAKHLGFYHFNSGLLYRALAYLLKTYKNYNETSLQKPLSNDVDTYLASDRFVCTFKLEGFHIFWDGEDITPHLKDKSLDQAASIISTDRHVRSILLQLQRKLAQNNNFVVDGRDSGSVVFPNADVKFFLTADTQVRAQRWQKDQIQRGNTVTLHDALEQIKMRDQRDKTRKYAPLIKPESSILIDNSKKTPEQTITIMLSHITTKA